MPNILRVCWEIDEIRLSLINIKRYGIPLEEGYLIEEVASETLGFRTLGIDCNNTDISNKNIEKELIHSGADRKLKRLVNRLRNNAVTFPIDDVRVDEQVIKCQWVYNQLRNLFQKDLCILDQNNDDKNVICFEEEKEAHEIVLIYKKREIILLNEQQIMQGIKEVDVIFELSFSLNTAMRFSVCEKWKENGISKSKELSKATFYHPIFYTGDTMNIHAEYEEGKWLFKLTHIDTNEEMFF